MRVLAEYAMRGRSQALAVSIVGAALPLLSWVSASIVSLVILRKGLYEGMLVLAGVSVPTLALVWITHDTTPVIALLGTVVLAYILRVTISWGYTLAIAILLGLISGWVFELTTTEIMAKLLELYLEMNTQIDAQAISEDQRELIATRTLIGLFAAGQMCFMIGFLMLARWWQSVLYNPGAFRREFHNLRLPRELSLVLMVLVFLFLLVGNPYFTGWVPVLTIPLVIGGIALAHYTLAEWKLNVNWLRLFYVFMLIFMQFVYPLLMILALADSWLDLRKKINRTVSNS